MENIKANPILRFSLLLTATVAGLFAVLYFAIPVFVLAPEDDKAEEVELTRADLTGRVVFSAHKQEGENISLKTYSINLNEENPTLVSVSDRFGVPSSSWAEFIDPNDMEKGGFFKTFTSDPASAEPVNALYKYTPEDGLKLWGGEVNEEYTSFGSVSFSPTTGLLAYVIEDKESDNSAFVENWSIGIESSTGERVALLEGAIHPAWMPDGDILVFLKADGVYRYQVSTKEELRLLQLIPNTPDAKVLIGSMLTVSPNGRYVLFVNQTGETIDVYQFNAEVNRLSPVTTIKEAGTLFTWPVVSPDSKAFAVVSYNMSGQGVLTEPRMEFRAIDNSEVVFSYPLNEFIIGDVYLDDWGRE